MRRKVETNKQSVGGFKVVNYSVKGKKDTEVVRLVLEADVDSIVAGECTMGDVQKAFLDHLTGDTEVGLSLFVSK